jgi:LPS-assembly lipoprotein
MTRYVTWAITALLALFVSACGFHLHGYDQSQMRPLPFKTLYIDASSGSATAGYITDWLSRDPRIKLVKSATAADAVLRITGESKTKEISIIDRSGSTSEYRLIYLFTAQLRVHGEQVGKDIELRQYRSLTYSDSAILGKDMEESLLWTDMQRSIVQVLVYRLSSDQVVKDVASAAASMVPPAPKPKAQNAGSQP